MFRWPSPPKSPTPASSPGKASSDPACSTSTKRRAVRTTGTATPNIIFCRCRASHLRSTTEKRLSNRSTIYWRRALVHRLLPPCFWGGRGANERIRALVKLLFRPLCRCLANWVRVLGRIEGRFRSNRASNSCCSNNSSVFTGGQFLSCFHRRTLKPFSSLSRSTSSSLKRICGRSCKK